ncbi:MAG: hypothetical protein K2L52_03590 [Clostridia bacterium]|nr:hypothetical protein [Clostridia bacterium]
MKQKQSNTPRQEGQHTDSQKSQFLIDNLDKFCKDNNLVVISVENDYGKIIAQRDTKDKDKITKIVGFAVSVDECEEIDENEDYEDEENEQDEKITIDRFVRWLK